MARGEPGIAEMIADFTANQTDARRVLALPGDIHGAVAAGGSTGNPLIDLSVLGEGQYVPEAAERYKEMQERIASSAGKTVLVASQSGAWPACNGGPGEGETRFAMGILTDEEPAIDRSTLSWYLPTERHVTWRDAGWYSGEYGAELRSAKLGGGPIKVSDYDPKESSVYRYKTPEERTRDHPGWPDHRSERERDLVEAEVSSCLEQLVIAGIGKGRRHSWRATSVLVGSEEIGTRAKTFRPNAYFSDCIFVRKELFERAKKLLSEADLPVAAEAS